jgi:hypothetical protein
MTCRSTPDFFADRTSGNLKGIGRILWEIVLRLRRTRPMSTIRMGVKLVSLSILATTGSGCCCSSETILDDAKTPACAEWDRELPQSVFIQEGSGDDVSYRLTRVVDGPTGAPIVGARVDLWEEAEFPGAEAWAPLHQQTLTTDIDGYALVEVGTAGWMFVDAEGYAPRASRGFGHVVRLERGVDHVIKVLDWMGRLCSST